MHLGLKALAAFFDDHRHAPSLVLATVVSTEGSTYRKPGAMLLATATGDFAGLISGGCLESDLVARAREVLETGKACRVDYDLKDDDELVLGLGLGCGGAVHLLLQRLDREDGFQPLGALFHAIRRGVGCSLGLVVNGGETGFERGQNVLEADDGVFLGEERLRALLHDPSATVVPGGRARRVRLSPTSDAVKAAQDESLRDESPAESAGGEAASMLVVRVEPPPRVLVCGAGVDALPVIRQVLALGWDCVVVDHRPDAVSLDRLPAGAEGHCIRPEALADAVALDKIHAAVVMSHHVNHDAAYLAQLATCPPSYLGLLGPRARKAQLLETTGLDGLPVRGPVGLDIGAELPESIALAIVAEIHACLNGRDGHALDPVAGQAIERTGMFASGRS